MPAIVQSAQGSATGTEVTVTLPAPATPGNCLIVTAVTAGSSSNGSVSAVTLGGSADNFGALKTEGTSGGDCILTWWADPDCAGGSSAVTVTAAGGTGTQYLTVTVLEASGMPSALSDLLDQSSATDSSGTESASWTSGTTGTTSQGPELWVGIAGTYKSLTITGPASPWVNLAGQSGGTQLSSMTGYQVTSSAGTAAYAGSFSSSYYYVAGVITLKGLSPAVVNQWAATFAQPSAFGITPPALESTVIALDSSTSVGGGTGTPTAGNWLFAVSGWNQAGLTAATTAVMDDTRQFWRPGDEETSTWAVSPASADSRVNAWYTANLARAPLDVYIAPSGAMAGRACLVIEVAGLGDWDTVTGIDVAYAPAATSLSLSLAAPSSEALVIGAVCGDLTGAGQAFAPSGWTALSAVTADNGTDHTCDAVLTSAYVVTSGAVSVSASATSATDLAGVLISVETSAAAPAGADGDWPPVKFEAAFGAGFQTSPDSMTWTDLSGRLWSWDETTGVQYQLGQIQATNLILELDNVDNHLATDNTSGPYYGDLVAGTPLRLRVPVGSPAGVPVNRWYVICRNAQEWPQEITGFLRRYAPVTGTDIWAATSAYGPTPYRGEVLADSPYAWWPCDDQPLQGGILPTSLRNAAPGNSNALDIVLSPNGATAQLVYSITGAAPPTNNVAAPPPVIATYTVGQNPGWMFGDPQSSPYGTNATGGSVSAQPGSSAWTQAGAGGDTGSYQFFLSCHDTSFPALSSGITVEGWFSFPFFGTPNGQTVEIYSSGGDEAGQPYCPLTIFELATSSAPVCILQVSTAGNLDFITYNGSTATSTTIYSAADMRTANWHQFTITMTDEDWTAYIDAGQTATVSGTGAGMTSAWTYLLAAGDTGTAGGSGTSSIAHSGNISLSHLAVYPAELPYYRIVAHYWAAVTAFGLLPSPQGVTATMTGNASGGTGNTWAQDGSVYVGTYTGINSPATSEISALVTANAGTYHSGPSAWAPAAVIGERVFAWVGWTTGLAPLYTIYTAASHGSETSASTTIGAGDSYTAGYGSAAAGAGRCHVASGTGATPPTAPTSTGDTAGQRAERIMSYAGIAGLGYGGVTSPCRCIDPSPALVQAATDIGGQQSGQNLVNIADSDSAWLFVDNQGYITYWQRTHLAAQYSSPAWTITPAASPEPGAATDAVPYLETLRWTADPQRVWNAITIQPFAPDGAALPLIIPADTTTVVSSQQQYGAQPFQITSYLQSQSEMAKQADWLLSNYGKMQIRVDNLEIDASSFPQAWPLVLGAAIGDIVSATNWQVGGGGVTGTFRISGIKRAISYGGQDGTVQGKITLQLDFEPTSYWTLCLVMSGPGGGRVLIPVPRRRPRHRNLPPEPSRHHRPHHQPRPLRRDLRPPRRLGSRLLPPPPASS